MLKVSLALLILLTFCKGSQVLNDISGEYLKNGENYKYNLKLNQDNTFTLVQKYQDARPQCQGKWVYLTKNTLLLNCNPIKNITELLTNGYMPSRENKIIILNRKKLKLGQVILTRKR